MNDKYDDQATQIIEEHCRMVEISTGVHEEMRAEIAAALRAAAIEAVGEMVAKAFGDTVQEVVTDRALSRNLAILIAKMLDSRDTDAAAYEVAHITLRDPDMKAAIEEARVFWKRVKPVDSPADDVGGG